MSRPLTLAAALASLAAQDPVTRAELSRTYLEGAPGARVRNTPTTAPNASS
jgi:hypothetical protein